MTDEDESTVRDKIQSAQMEFPVALAATDVNEKFPLDGGFPTSYIVERDGTVAWRGHPSQLTTGNVASLFD